MINRLRPSSNASLKSIPDGEYMIQSATDVQPICCEQLHVAFGSKTVLGSIDLRIDPGSIVGLLGVNGCGKTTLLQCLVGLLSPTRGTSYLLGENSWDLSVDAKSRIGYVPQTTVLPPWMTIRQVIDGWAAFHRRWDDRRCMALVDRFHIDVGQAVRTLSTGQAQRVSLLLALSHDPELLILDEPAAALDPEGRRALLQDLLEQNRDGQQTTLFSTHITSDLERVASHVAILSRGEVTYFGTLDELKDRVKRLHIQSSRPLPSNLDIQNAIEVKVDGTAALASVSQIDHESIEQLRLRHDADVTIEDLNLEDILLELNDV